jgi:hypothetical protein
MFLVRFDAANGGVKGLDIASCIIKGGYSSVCLYPHCQHQAEKSHSIEHASLLERVASKIEFSPILIGPQPSYQWVSFFPSTRHKLFLMKGEDNALSFLPLVKGHCLLFPLTFEKLFVIVTEGFFYI